MVVEPEMEPTSRHLSVRMLGRFQVTVNDVEIVFPIRAQHLIARLALAIRPLTRSTIAGTLWPDTSEARASACLRSVLWRIRTLDVDVVQSNHQHVWLAPFIDVDLRTLVVLARDIDDGRPPLPIDITWLMDDLVPEWDEEWLVFDRARARELRLHVLERLCRAYTDAHRHTDAVEAGYAAIASDPLRESAHAALIGAHLAEGNRHEAVRQFTEYRRLLDAELGFEPSTDLREKVYATAIRPSET